MPRRGQEISLTCTWPGCGRVEYWRADNRAEAVRYQQQREGYRCTAHKRPAENLRPDNLKVSSTLTSQSLGVSGCLFWVPEGGTTGSAFIHGPGFNAQTKDFPPGTRIRVTAEILIEEEPISRTSCNRHDDCAAAIEAFRAKRGHDPGFNFCCHDECCEECFGY